jgi:hypothetical protein
MAMVLHERVLLLDGRLQGNETQYDPRTCGGGWVDAVKEAGVEVRRLG